MRPSPVQLLPGRACRLATSLSVCVGRETWSAPVGCEQVRAVAPCRPYFGTPRLLHSAEALSGRLRNIPPESTELTMVPHADSRVNAEEASAGGLATLSGRTTTTTTAA